ncbi:MAG: putative glycoside hydrolase, partial [Acidimicrobiales bacterium]
DESFRDQLKAADPSLQVLQYVLANEIQDAGASQPWRNQAAWTTGDAAALLAQHPEWFARDEAGRPLAKSIGGGRTIYTMDPTQRGWTDYLVDRVLAHNIDAGWDGVFLDNVEMSLSKRRREGQIPAAHPTDGAWQDAMVGHVAAIRRAFAAAGRPVWANVIEGGDSAAEIERLAPHLEGTMDESFGTGWDRRPRTGSAWERDVAAVEARTARGDHSLLVAQGANGDAAALRYAFASYLLVATPTVSFRYADSATAYAEVWWSDEFDRQLGNPTGPRYRDSDRWARDFEGGRVTVDPTSGTAAIG